MEAGSKVRGVSAMRRVAAIAAVVATGALAAGAWAAVGDLTSAGCVEDEGAGPDSCAVTAEGLEQTREVVVSPDGADVYAVSASDSAVVPLRRNTGTGALSYVEKCVADPTSPENCTDAAGMAAASTLAISADGESVYVGAEADDAIVHFDRDPTDGLLINQGCVEDDNAPGSGCAGPVPGLNGVASVVVSPDGEHVYAAAITDSAIQIFDRNTATGALTALDCVRDSSLPIGGCVSLPTGLLAVRGIAISPDGTSLYATSEGDDAVVHFSRDAVTGALTKIDCFATHDAGGEATCTDVGGLANAYAAAVSPDGRSLYALGNTDDAIVRFDRDTGTGALSQIDCVDDDGGACPQSMTGITTPTRVAVSADGRSVYVTANSTDSIAVLDREPATGAITPSHCVGDDDSGPVGCAASAPGLDAIWGLALSPDGASLYTGSRVDNAVSHLGRELLAAPAPTPVPVPGKTIIVRPVSGSVTVKLPGSSAFVPIESVTAIPVGTEVDATKGVVNLTSQATGAATQSADFKFGRFKVTQSASRGAYTELKLTGSLGCGKKGKGKRKRGAARSASGNPVATTARRRGRSVWGSGSGRFRTSGRKGSGAARGTTWEVTDRCDGKTRIKSHEGKVTVRDFVRKRSLTIRTGQGYLAPGPKKLKKGKR